ncbi:MAG: T9SS type A sorting domain-containing protein [Bacteroidia bacterium]|nr:T9SS type A sorting domain-containing protein [Bacteroidia bacterium]
MKHVITLSLALSVALSSIAQKNVKFKIDHKLKDQAFSFNQESINSLGNKFNVKRLEYYISEISLVHDGGKTSDASDVYMLVNAGYETEVDLGQFNITNLEAINFSVGVDPGVNNADPTQWPKSHPLSPKSPSMHWGWASGYRFVAIEGKSGSSLNRVFEIHALGNDNYFDISIPTSGTDDNGDLLVVLNADYANALAKIDLSSGLIVHGEEDQAVTLLRNFQRDVFKSSEGNKNTVGLTRNPELQVTKLFPNPTSGVFTVSVSNMSKGISLFITDLTGRAVHLESINLESNTYAVLNKGVYVVTIRDSEGIFTTTRLVVD